MINGLCTSFLILHPQPVSLWCLHVMFWARGDTVGRCLLRSGMTPHLLEGLQASTLSLCVALLRSELFSTSYASLCGGPVVALDAAGRMSLNKAEKQQG